MKVAPLALLWTLALAFTYFNVTGLGFKENVAAYDALLWKGIKEGGKIVAMVFGAFVILNTLKKTGAIEDVKNTVAHISGSDRRVQLIVVGLMVPIFLEGAAGAGAPAAIAAPFLVALGFDPVIAIAVALLGDATPCSRGGAGLQEHRPLPLLCGRYRGCHHVLPQQFCRPGDYLNGYRNHRHTLFRCLCEAGPHQDSRGVPLQGP